MKIIVLAAGLGSRLSGGRSELPKPLTPLKTGETIMFRQVNSIKEEFNLHDLMVVVGYKMNMIMESFPELLYVYNEDFSTTNTSKSLMRALLKVRNEGALWFNGDVVFDVDLLQKLTPYILMDESFVCVNNSKVADEEVKYTLDSSGYILELSKTVKNGVGEAVGINFISSKDIEGLKEKLIECESQDYFEKGLEMLIRQGVKIKPLNISDHFCMEVDFQEDLENVNNALK
jgi:L-glutamine-phosphate cytidylyltransferase